MSVSRTGLVLPICVIVAVSSGCADPYAGRKELSGTVTVKGQPLKSGTIFFDPMDGQSFQANQFITDGKFKIERANGLLPGKYKVRISAADPKTSVNEEEAGGPGGSANITFFDIIPPEWNTASTQEVTIKGDGANEFTFDIPKTLEPKRGRR